MSPELSQKFKKDYTVPMADTKAAQAAVYTAPRIIPVQHDIMVRVTAPGLDAAKVMVGTIMSAPLVTIAESESVGNAVALMGRHGIRRLPIVDQAGFLVTLLTLDDILRLNLADSSVLTGIVREQARRAGDGSPDMTGSHVVRFADVPPPPLP
ncbi:MAG: putative signal transduction protein, partial [bacterium]